MPVVCVGIGHMAAAELAALVGPVPLGGIAKLGRMIRCFNREGVRQVVMAGKISQDRDAHAPAGPCACCPTGGPCASGTTGQRRDNRDDTLLLARH